MRFLDVVAAHALLAHQRTFVDRRNIFNFAIPGHFHAVIPAGDTIAEIPAHRQTGTAVRAAVFQRLQLSVLVTPHHNLFAETGNTHRSGLHFPARQNRIPQAT